MDYKRTLSNYLGHRTDPAKVAMALLAGLAAGAILGVLFAPESGDETRYRLSDKARELANDAKDKFQSVKSKFRGDINNMTETHQEAIKTAKSKARNTAADVKDYAADVVATAKSKVKNVSVDQNGSIQGI